MQRRSFTSPAIVIFDTGNEKGFLEGSNYDYNDNGIETGGGETNPGDDFWD